MVGGPVSQSLLIQTTRFGQVQFQTEDLLTFPEGVLGFADLKKFVLLDDPNDDIFAWLQSCDEPAIAFPVLEPELFSDAYKVSLAKADLDIGNSQHADIGVGKAGGCHVGLMRFRDIAGAGGRRCRHPWFRRAAAATPSPPSGHATAGAR